MEVMNIHNAGDFLQSKFNVIIIDLVRECFHENLDTFLHDGDGCCHHNDSEDNRDDWISNEVVFTTEVHRSCTDDNTSTLDCITENVDLSCLHT